MLRHMRGEKSMFWLLPQSSERVMPSTPAALTLSTSPQSQSA